MIELRERLKAIASYVPFGSVVIDVGTDHAYLPIYLVQAGICPQAVGVDVHYGPFHSALEQVRVQGLADRIKVILGDGLKPVKPGSGDVVTIAGMGGTTMRDILQSGPQVLSMVRRLILQPQVGGNCLRLWLIQNGWALVDERLVEEDNRVYTIIVAEPGVQNVPGELELEFGPLILARKDPLLRQVIGSQLANLEKIMVQLANVQTEEISVKKLKLAQRIDQLRGLLV